MPNPNESKMPRDSSRGKGTVIKPGIALVVSKCVEVLFNIKDPNVLGCQTQLMGETETGKVR